MQTTAFIGLGVMGYPMAGHLQQQGFSCCVYNRSEAKAQRWVQEFGGTSASTPREAAKNADVVFVCVGNDDDVRAVVEGPEGVLAGMKAGAILVDHTTASAELAREIAACAEAENKYFVDAPVSGGQAGAERGALSIMMGGDAALIEQLFPVLASYARIQKRIGPVGSGQLCKMVNQICIGGLIQSLAEAIYFAERAELDLDAVMAVISQGAAQSWQMENRQATMRAGEYEHGFAVDWMRKDFAIVFAQAKQLGIELPITALVDDYYSDVQAMGGSRWDTSSLLARLKKLSA